MDVSARGYPLVFSISEHRGTPLKSIATYSFYLDTLSSIFLEIGRSAPSYQTLALFYPQSKRLRADINEYIIVIVGFCYQLWMFAHKSIVNRSMSALSASELRTYQSSMESWANAIKEEVNLP